ncbi:MAG: glycosyltransferase family 2 protein [Cyclobacteriaceae bacterium]|nr:glycosyltransferase family 2 protein [Cyclobacteriaceae bacterium]
MNAPEITVILLYSISLLYIFLFSMSQLHLTWIYRHQKSYSNDLKETPYALANLPLVTIQLPIYNEKYVVDRLLDAICKVAYPHSKLEIQILDDSTDETTQIILKKIASLRPMGLDIKLIHRENRSGFKAGALDHGFHLAKGEFIAIFDADFIPEPDFLTLTLPHFADPHIGVVQTRWGHINRDYSWLTELQAFGLDAHFSIEQVGRNTAGSFINFNGTCGVWRKETIEDAGGWKFDTLTEDLDLSYRAQLKGWKFKYLEDVVTPGELPVIMPAIKSQQYRWNKGGAETARKIFGSVLRSTAPVQKKIHSFFHLFNSSVFVFLLIASLLSIPMLFIKTHHPEIGWLFNTGIVFLVGFFSISLFYWTATKRFYSNPVKKFFRLFPGFLLVSMGLSLHNGLAVLEGLLGIKTPFIRTPKFNITRKGESWRNNDYIKPTISLLMVMEGLLCLYFSFGIACGLYLHDWSLMIFHVMLTLGFGVVSYHSMKPTAHA